MSDFNLGQALRSYKENSEITVLDAGTYVLECTSATSGVAAGGPTITPVFKVVGGPQAGSRVMVGKMSFAEGALWKTMPQVMGFGISEEYMEQANSQPDPIKTLANAMVGRVVEATVKIEPWQGEDRNKLVSVKIADGGLSSAAAPPPPQTQAPTPTETPAPVSDPAIVARPEF